MEFGRDCVVKLLAWSLIAPIAGAVVGGPAARADPALRDRVLREYPQALARLEAAYAQIDARGLYTRPVGVGTPTERLFRFTLSLEKRGDLRHTRRVWDEKDRMGRIIEEIRCDNPEKYTFTAVRYEAGGPLVVRDLGHQSGAFEEHYGIYYRRHAEVMYSVFGTPVSRMMADPSFRIRDATGVTRGGKEFIRIDYDFNPKETVLRSGWVEVAPADGWVIHRYESQMKPEFKNKTVVGEVEYVRDEPTGQLVPGRSVVRSPDGVHTVVFDSYRVGPSLGEGHFTLASFGIPEVGSPSRRGRGVQPFFWVATAAVVSLAVAVGARYASSWLEMRAQRRGRVE